MHSALILITGYSLVFALIAFRVCNSIYVSENWIRLHTALIWLKNLPIFYSHDAGPVLNSIYSPLSFMVYGLVRWAPTPHGFIQAASALSSVLIYSPVLIWILFGRRDVKSDRINSFLTFYVFISVGMLFYPIRNAAFNIHADAPMLFFSALSAFFIAQEKFRQKTWMLFASALMSVLAVWSKQIAVSLCLALPSYLLLVSGVRKTLQYTAFLILTGLIVSAFFFHLFDSQAMLFHLIEIPKRHPFRPNLVASVWPLFRDLLMLLPMVLIAIWPQLKESDISLREWCRKRHWTILFWIALFMLPLSILGSLKVGGSRNTISYTTYFVLAGLFLAPLGRPLLRMRLQFISILCITVQLFAVLHQCFWQSQKIDFAAIAENKIISSPGSVYFPRLPLLHLWYENKIYHDGIGLRDHHWSSLKPSIERLRTHIPPNVQVIAFYENDSDDMDLFRNILPEFEGSPTYKEDLPGFRVYLKKYLSS